VTVRADLVLRGVAASLPAANVDTDVIMPKRYLKGIDRSGLATGIFHDLRYRPDGSPIPDFVLNRPPWSGATFLVVGPNFGCGSSREHAVWGLLQLGIRGIIGTSFAGIFLDNCLNNGLLAIALDPAEITRLSALAAEEGRCRLCIDVPKQTLTSEGDGVTVEFELEPERKHMLLHDLDAVGATLEHRTQIALFEARYFGEHPWLA
jgi:3-isopropylmalate/(R)-2-methylmalate dehydratase small subunit